MKEKILVTGGAGFIGSALVLKLIDKNYEVRVIDNLLPQVHGNSLNSYSFNSIKNKVKIIKEDIRNYNEVKKAICKQDIIIHLASETGTGQSMTQIERYTNANINGIAVLFDVLINEKQFVKKMILASSRAIYGEGKYECETHGIFYPGARKNEDMLKGDFEIKCPLCLKKGSPLPTDEESKLEPTSIYGITKHTQEEIFQNMGKYLDISCISLRFQNVYGQGQSLSNPYTGILSIFTNLMKMNKEINVFEDGNESRDFVFIEDVVESIIMSVEHKNPKTDIFNVGSGTRTKILDLANILKKELTSRSNILVSGNYRIGDIRHNLADIKKIKSEMGFCPKISLHTGLQRFIEWAYREKYEENNFSKTLVEMKKVGMLK